MEPIERFQVFPYQVQSPLSGELVLISSMADIWSEVEAIAELAKTSKKRTIGHLLFDLVPLFACPTKFAEDWMIDMLNEHHWITNWNISPGNLDSILADRIESWTIIENELSQVKRNESESN